MFLCRTVKTTGRPLAQAIQPQAMAGA